MAYGCVFDEKWIIFAGFVGWDLVGIDSRAGPSQFLASFRCVFDEKWVVFWKVYGVGFDWGWGI